MRLLYFPRPPSRRILRRVEASSPMLFFLLLVLLFVGCNAVLANNLIQQTDGTTRNLHLISALSFLLTPLSTYRDIRIVHDFSSMEFDLFNSSIEIKSCQLIITVVNGVVVVSKLLQQFSVFPFPCRRMTLTCQQMSVFM